MSPLTTTYYLLLKKKVLGNFDEIDLEILEKQQKLLLNESRSKNEENTDIQPNNDLDNTDLDQGIASKDALDVENSEDVVPSPNYKTEENFTRGLKKDSKEKAKTHKSNEISINTDEARGIDGSMEDNI